MRVSKCICDFCGTESNLFREWKDEWAIVGLVHGGVVIEDPENEFADGKEVHEAISSGDISAHDCGMAAAVLDICPACMLKQGITASQYGEIVLDIDMTVGLYWAFLKSLRLIKVLHAMVPDLVLDTLPDIMRTLGAFQLAGGSEIIFPATNYEAIIDGMKTQPASEGKEHNHVGQFE